MAMQSQIDVPTILSFIFMVLLIALTISLYLIRSRSGPMKGRRNIYNQEEVPYRYTTVIRCITGDFNTEREFQEGDFVGKIAGKCPKCGNNLVVDAIYALYMQRRR